MLLQAGLLALTFDLTQAYIHSDCASLTVQEVWRKQAVGRHGWRHASESCQQAGVARLPHDRLHARNRGHEGGVISAASALFAEHSQTHREQVELLVHST